MHSMLFRVVRCRYVVSTPVPIPETRSYVHKTFYFVRNFGLKEGEK